MQAVPVKKLTAQDKDAFMRLQKSLDKHDPHYFEDLMNRRALILYGVYENETLCAYGYLNFAPKYQLYRRLNCPEIQDLNVDPAYRGRGIATTLIAKMESAARDQNYDMIGISVGLYKDYGPAQRLYYKLGYQPDGNGLTYDRQYIEAGQHVRVDDDLCLMMIKTLN